MFLWSKVKIQMDVAFGLSSDEGEFPQNTRLQGKEGNF